MINILTIDVVISPKLWLKLFKLIDVVINPNFDE